MSLETMYALAGLEEYGRLAGYNMRQQITPSITFMCDGWITKWIIGALWGDTLELFPELQIWRKAGNETYRKISGTRIVVDRRNENLIYEYSNFTPIPFQAGDVLGAFVPLGNVTKLKLRSEGNRGPLNYYILTNNAPESPYNNVNLSGTLTSATFHPLISVEISKHKVSLILGIEFFMIKSFCFVGVSTSTRFVQEMVIHILYLHVT